MEKLIDNQTIAFDPHHAGNREAQGLDGLHMHKRMNGKRYGGIEVLIPLDGKKEIVFRGKNATSDLERSLIKEIKVALADKPQDRERLVETVMKTIERYAKAEGQSHEERIESIRTGAMQVAELFSKNGHIQNDIEQRINKRLEFLITSHFKNDGSLFYVKQDLLRGRLKISDDLEELNYANGRRVWKD